MFARKIIFALSALVLSSNFAYSESQYIFRVGTKVVSGSSDSASKISLNINDMAVGGQMNNVRATFSGSSDPVTWSLSGRLPHGVNFSPDGSFNGAPTEGGVYNFTLAALVAGETRASRKYSFKVSNNLVFEGQDFVGNVYKQAVPSFIGTVSGGSEPYTYSLIAGELPPGYTIISAQNAFAFFGDAAPAGEFSFAVRVVDGNEQSATADFSITLQEGLNIAASFPEGYVGVPYSGQFIVQGGSESRTFTASGVVPGLTWSNNVLSGIPTETSHDALAHPSLHFPVSATLTDGTAQENLQHNIKIWDQVKITTSEMKPISLEQDVYINEPTKLSFGVTGGNNPFVWTLEDRGNLPSDLSLVNTYGRNIQFNSRLTAAGTYHFTLGVIDGNNTLPLDGRSDSKTFTVTAYEPLGTIFQTGGSWVNNQPRTAGVPIEPVQFETSGGKKPYSWSVSTGTLPDGLTLSSEGLLSGTPTQGAKIYSFTVRVTDSNGRNKFASFMNQINNP